MYVLVCPCIGDPSLRASGITDATDRMLFARCLERCRHFGVEVVYMPCPETEYLGADRKPGSFLERLNTGEFKELMDRREADVRAIIGDRGTPLAIIGVDSSPTCGVHQTYYSDVKQPGRGAFLARFPEIKAFDVTEFARYRIYLAGPLFSEAELAFNRRLYDELSRHLFSVYLPQEVGDTSRTREKEEYSAIFSRHVKALEEADIVVAVVDGPDADSGTAWEMGYAYALGKIVIALRTDFRRAGRHELVNLMLEESATVVTRIEDLTAVLKSPLI